MDIFVEQRSSFHIYLSISLLRLIYYLACENKIHKGLAWQTPEAVWRYNHHTPVKRELQLGFIVSSPLDTLMTELPPSTLSIWDFTATVYKWDFHDKQLCIRFPCVFESENDLLRLCWERVLMKTKSISGYFSQEHYHDDNIMTLSYASTLSPCPPPKAALQEPPVHTLPMTAITAPSPWPAAHQPATTWRGQDLPSAQRAFPSFSFHKPSLEMFAFV